MKHLGCRMPLATRRFSPKSRFHEAKQAVAASHPCMQGMHCHCEKRDEVRMSQPHPAAHSTPTWQACAAQHGSRCAAAAQRRGRPARQVRAGTGGEEAALWAADLVRMYQRYADGQGWRATRVTESTAESGGVKEAILQVAGRAAARGSCLWESFRMHIAHHRRLCL